MKKQDCLHYAALALLSHVAQGAAFILLLLAAAGSTASFSFGKAYGLVLGVLITAVLSFGFGWGLRPKAPLPKNLCWNAAMVLYIVNLAALLCKGSPSLYATDAAHLPAFLWVLPMIPAFTGIGALLPSTSAAWYIALALLAAVEPLCFTLGLTCAKTEKSPASAENPPANADTTTDKETTPNA